LPYGKRVELATVSSNLWQGWIITTNDPFANPTPDQYVRIAGLLSFVSFVVGYDPTRFQYILSLKPGGRGKG